MASLVLALELRALGVDVFFQSSTVPHKIIDECGNAVVLTLDSTQISACSCDSIASKGKFVGKKLLLLCMNFYSANYNTQGYLLLVLEIHTAKDQVSFFEWGEVGKMHG